MVLKDVAGSTRRRPGSTSLFVILAAVVLLAALGLAIDLAHLWEARVSLENSADAAALAATQALVSDRVLTGDPAVLIDRLRRARAEAIRYARDNPVLGASLPLDPNLDNQPEGDILFGTLDSPRSTLFVPAQNITDPTNPSLGLVNAVRIAAQRTRARGNPAGLYLGQALSLDSADLVAVATAMLDRDVIGFRPVLNQPLPMAPIALLSDPTGSNSSSWESRVVAGTGPDEFRFDPTTRTFVEDPNGDGLHEMQVELGDNGCLLLLGVADAAAAAGQVRSGVTAAQLQDLGGQIVLGDQNQLPVPAAPGCGPAAGTPQAADLQASLEQLRLRGDLRIWPLFTGLDAHSGATVLTGFVAARVVEVDAPATGEPVRFTLQPGMLSTASAVTDASRRVGTGNPYLCKVRLVH
jgi:hypothetical protein